VKCGLRTSSHPDPLSRAQPLSDTSKTSSRNLRSIIYVGILPLFART